MACSHNMIAQSNKEERIPFYETNKRVKIVSLELVGPSGIPSLNYDFRFRQTHDKWGMRIGIGALPFLSDDQVGVIGSAHVNYLIGNKSHKLDIGGV